MRNLAWTERAKCASLDTEMFFADEREPGAIRNGLEVCMGCPVYRECLKWAAESPASWKEGVYGGLRSSERTWETPSPIRILPNLDEALALAEDRQICASDGHPEISCRCEFVKQPELFEGAA